MSNANLKINYIELPMEDHAATKLFYESVFGWEFQDWGPDYLCFTGAGIDLGFNRATTPSPHSSGALVVVYADDLEGIESAISQAGCLVVQAPFDFPGGRRFHFADPNGNEIAVWTKAEAE